MQCFTFSCDVVDVQLHGQTPYQFRFGNVPGKLVPFGAEIHYTHYEHGKVVKDHPMGEKTRKGLFFGYHIYTGGKLSGDYFVLDSELCHNAGSIHQLKPVRVKDIVVPHC